MQIPGFHGRQKTQGFLGFSGVYLRCNLGDGLRVDGDPGSHVFLHRKNIGLDRTPQAGFQSESAWW